MVAHLCIASMSLEATAMTIGKCEIVHVVTSSISIIRCSKLKPPNASTSMDPVSLLSTVSTSLQHYSLPDLNAIEESTRTFLELIREWNERTISASSALYVNTCTSRTISIDSRVTAFRPELAEETRKQVASYVAAYNNALKSAQVGHTAAEEGRAITAIEWSKISQAERDGYIAEMINISKEGKKHAQEALEGFHKVGKGIKAVGYSHSLYRYCYVLILHVKPGPEPYQAGEY